MKSLTPKEIKAELDNVHRTSAPAFATVYNWVKEFKRGRIATCDTPHWGRPIEASMPEIIDKVHDIDLTDRRVKVRELVEATVISHGTMTLILHEQLGMKKLSARWVPRLLTVDHKRDRVTISKQWRCFSKQVINGDYYAALLDHFNNILKKRRPHLAKKKVLFHQNNTHVSGTDGQIKRIPLRIISSFSIFATFSPLATISCFQT
ncbi:GVQW3 protein, partial [Acromyrmex charruanus]